MPCQVRLRFGQLFGAAMAVGVSFTVLVTIAGAVAAFVAPESFQLNGARATDPVEALLALAMIFGIGFGITLVVSLIGAVAWMAFRRILPVRSALG